MPEAIVTSEIKKFINKSFFFLPKPLIAKIGLTMWRVPVGVREGRQMK